MNPFLLSPEERNHEWKACRERLKTMNEDEQLAEVSAFWAQVPLSKTSFDITDPTTWGTPWEMMHAGNWCALSRAIGMDFTLRLGGWNPDRLRLILANDHSNSETIMVVEIDNQIILNYDMRKPINMPTRPWTIIGTWKFTGKFYE